MTIDAPRPILASDDQEAPRPARVFWVAALAAGALALLAVYGGAVGRPMAGGDATAMARPVAPVTPFGDFVELAERINPR